MTLLGIPALVAKTPRTGLDGTLRALPPRRLGAPLFLTATAVAIAA